MKQGKVVLAVMVGIAVLAFVSGVIADPSSRTTRVTFSGPVRVPGANLSAGTYFFRAPNVTNRMIVRIEDENRQFVTQFMGIPDKTRNRTHDIVLFGDHECGPKAVKSWFFPGSNTGVRFVYPQEEAALIAASIFGEVSLCPPVSSAAIVAMSLSIAGRRSCQCPRSQGCSPNVTSFA